MMSDISALTNAQASLLARSQSIAGGNTDPATLIGLATDQNNFKTGVKVLKAQDDMTKEVLNLISPDKVDVTV